MTRALKTAVLAVGAFLLVAGITASAMPQLLYTAAAWWYDPGTFPSLDEDPRIHYEPGAEAYARAVAAIMPQAVKRVETAQGRPFAAPITVTVFATQATYRQWNGLGSYKPKGTSLDTRVSLSPGLWTEASGRNALEPILTHELSHVHFQTYLGPLKYARIPRWFLEGVAVVVSNGGGAEKVSSDAARRAIASRYAITVSDTATWLHHGFDTPQPSGSATSRDDVFYNMMYRQAALFVAFLQDHNPKGFAELMSQLLDGRPFASAFDQSLGYTVADAWNKFTASIGPLGDGHSSREEGGG